MQIDPLVLAADRHFLVLNKPARVLVASDASGDETLLEATRHYVATPERKGYVAPVHFLDRPVSGAILFALSTKAASRFGEQFRDRQVRKIYWALVEGRAAPGLVRCEDFLSKDAKSNVVRVVPAGHPDGKRCVLSYERIASHGAYDLLAIHLETGRSHQIRVQLSSRGLPIMGDRKYGAREDGDGAIALHARELHFFHPISGEPIQVTAPCPSHWKMP